MLSPRLPPWLEISDRTLPGASASPGLIRQSATDSPEDPPRFPHGFYEAAFYIDGAFDKLAPKAFRDLLFRALKNHSGWPPFVFLDRPPYSPRPVDDAIEAWLGANVDGSYAPPSHSDYWRIRAYFSRQCQVA